ncbi:MAG: iron-containing alcohol dehydrogenase [Alphaproteobacteria bacterium]|nr:iron-containing alcohol dehydrogenase [Alphaproteobacteria bacterium]
MKTLYPVPEIAVGVGRIDKIGADLAGLKEAPKRVLLVIDRVLSQGGVAKRVRKALATTNHELALWDGFAGEPTAAQIDDAAKLARTHDVEAVIGIGGGSALDVAKLVAAIASAPAGVEHYAFCANPLPAKPLPVLCVPTTAGTGSETTLTAIFANAAGKKAWAWGPELATRKAILDASLTISLPAPLTAATGIDALVHAVESCTNANRFEANDVIAHAAIRLVARHLPTAVRAPQNLEAREGMLVASCYAGIAINNTGTAIAHNIAHALGSLGKVHHGRAAGLGLRASLPWSLPASESAFADVAAAMGGSRDAKALPDLVDDLIRVVGMKVTLADELPGITPERLAEEMALPENDAMRKSSARPSTDRDLRDLARAVLTAS